MSGWPAPCSALVLLHPSPPSPPPAPLRHPPTHPAQLVADVSPIARLSPVWHRFWDVIVRGKGGYRLEDPELARAACGTTVFRRAGYAQLA